MSMEDAQVALIQRLADDLEPPAGRLGKMYEHEEWRDMAAVVALMLLDRRSSDRAALEFNPDDEYVHEDHYPLAAVAEELREQWGVVVHREALRRFIRSSVEPLIVNSEVGIEFHRRMAVRAKGRLDTVASTIENAQKMRDLADEIQGRVGEAVVDEASGKLYVAATYKNAIAARKAVADLDRQEHDMLASIGWAPPLVQRGGATVNTQVNVAFDPAALGGIGTRRSPSIDAERA